MPHWKLKLVVVTTAWMLLVGHCGAQTQSDTAVAPQHAASAAQRSARPTPYRAPIIVPSAAGSIAPLPLPPPTTVLTLPAAPAFTSSCDSSGCWGADGSRYNAVGGSLLRPDGRMCQNIAGVMQCQ